MAQDGNKPFKMDIPTFATSDDGTTHNQERQMSQGWRLVGGLGGGGWKGLQGAYKGLLGGPRHFVTSYNWTYNPIYNLSIRTIRGLPPL